MNNKQISTGFWVVFILIVVVFGVLAIPKYCVLSKQIQEAHARSYVATLTSASAANYTQRKSNVSNGVPVKNCTDVVNIGNIKLPDGDLIASQDIDPEKVAICTLNVKGISAVQFSVIGIN